MLSFVEKTIYNLLKKVPFLKKIFRNIYQRINVFFTKINKININYEFLFKSGYFFGFHDKNPLSYDNEKLLVHNINIEKNKLNLPKKSDFVSVGFLHGKNFEKYYEIGKTNAWNFQQGSMLQWINKNEIIYNYYDLDKCIHKSIIFNTSSLKSKSTSLPVGAVSKDGKYGVSYSFERLRKGMKGYGYANGIDKDYDNNTPKNGIKLFDIHTGRIIREIKIKELGSLKTTSFKFFTHVQFSPDSKNFVFFLREKEIGIRQKTRMFLYNIDRDYIYCFPTDDMISHVSWINNDKLIGYASVLNQDSYYIFDYKKNTYDRIKFSKNDVDGHPNVSLDTTKLVFDTYPNKKRIQSLYLYNFNTKSLNLIGQFFSPFKYKDELRCDLHPRFNKEGNLIVIDSAYNGTRGIGIINLKGEKSEI